MTTKTTSFHKSNFGRFGAGLPTDNEGYVHLTAKAWREVGYSRDDAREMASRAKEAVRDAETALAEWRDAN